MQTLVFKVVLAYFRDTQRTFIVGSEIERGRAKQLLVAPFIKNKNAIDSIARKNKLSADGVGGGMSRSDAPGQREVVISRPGHVSARRCASRPGM